jgi:hypothetical protein
MELLAATGDVWVGALMTLANVVVRILFVLGVRHVLRNQPEYRFSQADAGRAGAARLRPPHQLLRPWLDRPGGSDPGASSSRVRRNAL